MGMGGGRVSLFVVWDAWEGEGEEGKGVFL